MKIGRVETVFCSNAGDGEHVECTIRTSDGETHEHKVEGGEITVDGRQQTIEKSQSYDPSSEYGIVVDEKYDDGMCRVENNRIMCEGGQGTTMRKAEVSATLGVELKGSGADGDAAREIKRRLRENFDSVSDSDVYVL